MKIKTTYRCGHVKYYYEGEPFYVLCKICEGKKLFYIEKREVVSDFQFYVEENLRKNKND